MHRHLEIIEPSADLQPADGYLSGGGILQSDRRLKHLSSVFEDEDARLRMDGEQLVYSVRSFLPVAEGTPGGLFFGTSTIYPGKVKHEYFMTRGHLHVNADRGEYYWCLRGEGMLILMNRERTTWAERMLPGSVHYINGFIAHRVANTGTVPLIFGASWPSDAGHDYESLKPRGFSARLMEVDGKPILVGR